MDKSKPNHMISVDTETGVYWNGQSALRTQAQINDATCPASMTKKLSANYYVAYVESLVQLAAMKVIRTTAKYFEVNSFHAY